MPRHECVPRQAHQTSFEKAVCRHRWHSYPIRSSSAHSATLARSLCRTCVHLTTRRSEVISNRLAGPGTACSRRPMSAQLLRQGWRFVGGLPWGCHPETRSRPRQENSPAAISGVPAKIVRRYTPLCTFRNGSDRTPMPHAASAHCLTYRLPI